MAERPGNLRSVHSSAPRCPVPKWSRRLGAAAFLFFLVKGLLWVAVPALVALGVWGR